MFLLFRSSFSCSISPFFLSLYSICSLISWLSFFFFSQCDTSAQGGSPSSTLTRSTASPCSESPSSTLSTSAGGQPLPQPLPLPSPQCSSSTSPSGTLSSPVPSPAPGPAPGPFPGSSPGPPCQSPTSTLESKDSGITGETCGCVSWPRSIYMLWVQIAYYTRQSMATR